MTWPDNPHRVGLILATATPVAVVATFVSVTINGFLVTYLHASAPVFRTYMTQDGDWCTKGGILTSVGLTCNVSMTELVLPEAEINAQLDEFKRRY
jgi:hypothetical protein